MSESIENVGVAEVQSKVQASAIPGTEQVNDMAQEAPPAEETAGPEAQEKAQDEAPPVQDESAAKFMQRATAAFRRGNNALLMSRVECGFWCHEYYSWRHSHGFKDRGSSTELLASAMAPFAENSRDVRPADFARYYGIASTLGTVKVSSKGKITGIGDGLTLGKLEALSPLIQRPEGTETYALYFAPEKADERKAAAQLWQDANADGKERVSLEELGKRVAYLRDPAQGRAYEVSTRIKKAKTAAEWDSLTEWAKTFGEAMLPDGRSVLAHVLEAKAKAFPAPKAAGATDGAATTTTEPRATSATAQVDSEDEDEDEDEEGEEKNPTDQRGTVTGNLLSPDTAYSAQDAAELCAGIMAKSEEPDSAIERMLLLVAKNTEFATKTRLLAARMASFLASTEKTSPVKIAEQLTDTISPANGVPAALAK
jgi:hypothetical protein